MKVKRIVIVERGKGKRNFSCFAPEGIGKYYLAGYGTSAREAMEDIQTTVQECKEMAAKDGDVFPDVELDFRFDVGAFFDYYPLDITAAAKYIGINASVLRQYVTALREPKQAQIDKIRDGVARLAEELSAGLMISQPAVAYTK